MIGRFLPGVRARFVALLLLAGIPMFAMAASIAWQNHRIVADATRQRVIRAREASAARHETLLVETERLLTALVAIPDLLDAEPSACDAILRRVMAVPGGRYSDVGVLDTRGRLRCAGALGPTNPVARDADFSTDPAFRSAREGRFAIGVMRASRTDGRPVLPVGMPLFRDGVVRGVAITGLRMEWLSGPVGDAGWALADAREIPLRDETERALPVPADLARLPDLPDQVLAARSRDGRRFVYAETRMQGGIRLLFAEPAAEDLARARAVLGRRLAELGVLLIAGLAAVALGVDAAIVRPLQLVARAVSRWRAGGTFETSVLPGAPAEVAELETSFAEAAAALGAREEQLRVASAQQELLMQEIHHRVKNNLQIIASLLNLQASRIRLPEARAEFQAARDRIRALATLHRHLYAYGELHTINMRGFLQELCQQLLQALGETPEGGRIALEIEAPELRLSSDQAVPMALIVTEAVSNAVKYAFPGGRSGHVAVRLADEPGADDAVRLTIEDDGVGIPAGRAVTEAGVRDGIGLQLIRGFARQLGAELEVTEDQGTRYSLLIPLRRARDPAES